MLTYNLNETQLPLYDALYRAIKADILSGRLAPGEKLPSKRALAQHLRLSVATVQNAYAQLLAEGYLYSEEKRGYYVSTIGDSLPVPAQKAPPNCAFRAGKGARVVCRSRFQRHFRRRFSVHRLVPNDAPSDSGKGKAVAPPARF